LLDSTSPFVFCGISSSKIRRSSIADAENKIGNVIVLTAIIFIIAGINFLILRYGTSVCISIVLIIVARFAQLSMLRSTQQLCVIYIRRVLCTSALSIYVNWFRIEIWKSGSVCILYSIVRSSLRDVN
jgi:uncharacterized membrane protein